MLGRVAWVWVGLVVGCSERPAEPVEHPPTPSVIEPVAIQPTPLVLLDEAAMPEPEPPPFSGHETVRADELLAAIEAELPRIAESDQVAADYAAFVERFELEDRDRPELYLDYVRVKVAFEATRAGGWWGLRWNITNEQPNSELIWAAWRELALTDGEPLPIVTATAECDELSALFAFVAQRIGLARGSEVGLLWPTGNHVVAVWTIDAKSEQPIRVVVPTSQIFLDGDQTLGTDGFDPWRQKTIYDYRRQDAAVDLELPAALARAFVLAVREHGPRPVALLQVERNAKEAAQWTD